MIDYGGMIMTDMLKKQMDHSIDEARKKQYSVLVEETKPPKPILKNVLMAFLFGGAICLLGQIIYELLALTEIIDKHCVTITLVILIFLGSLLTGLGVYDKIGSIAGAGSVVPISGFANSLVAPAMEWRTEGLVGGLAAKLFTLAGPVILYGIVGSFFLGVIKYLQLVFSGGF